MQNSALWRSSSDLDDGLDFVFRKPRPANATLLVIGIIETPRSEFATISVETFEHF
jgi:hypothetical protein